MHLNIIFSFFLIFPKILYANCAPKNITLEIREEKILTKISHSTFRKLDCLKLNKSFKIDLKKKIDLEDPYALLRIKPYLLRIKEVLDNPKYVRKILLVDEKIQSHRNFFVFINEIEKFMKVNFYKINSEVNYSIATDLAKKFFQDKLEKKHRGKNLFSVHYQSGAVKISELSKDIESIVFKLPTYKEFDHHEYVKFISNTRDEIFKKFDQIRSEFEVDKGKLNAKVITSKNSESFKYRQGNLFILTSETFPLHSFFSIRPKDLFKISTKTAAQDLKDFIEENGRKISSFDDKTLEKFHLIVLKDLIINITKSRGHFGLRINYGYHLPYFI